MSRNVSRLQSRETDCKEHSVLHPFPLFVLSLVLSPVLHYLVNSQRLSIYTGEASSRNWVGMALILVSIFNCLEYISFSQSYIYQPTFDTEREMFQMEDFPDH